MAGPQDLSPKARGFLKICQRNDLQKTLQVASKIQSSWEKKIHSLIDETGKEETINLLKKEKRPELVVHFVRHIENLTKEQINELSEIVANSENYLIENERYNQIEKFLEETASNLTDEEILKTILETRELKLFKRFVNGEEY